MSEATTVIVPMPHMGVSVEEGTVIEWLVAVGDEVSEGQAICAVATDKVDTEIEAPVGGVLAEIVVEVDQNVAVGAPLAVLDTAEGSRGGVPGRTQRGEDSADASEEVGASRTVSGDPTPAALSDSKALSSVAANSAGDLNSTGGDDAGLAARAAAGRDAYGRFDPKAAAAAVLSFQGTDVGVTSSAPVLASPVAKRMAQKHGVDLGAVEGSGRGGRVRKADVERALGDGGAPSLPRLHLSPDSGTKRNLGVALGADGLPAGYEGVPHEVVKTSRVRQVIAEHMVRSRQTAAHMTTEVDVDISAVVRARTELNANRVPQGEPKLSYLPFIARAACVSLDEHPRMNATFLGEQTILWQAINLGVAVDTPEGLMVPVIRDCGEMTAPTIAAAIADLAERARTRKLAPDDLAGGTFTLSNPGSVGAVSAPAIINQPQVAILGVPTIQRRPWVIADEQGNEAIAIRSILRLAVTFDHRAVDGADATRFAVSVKDHLESWEPEAFT